nr:GntR family transcriptional regulator [Nocardiopsis kunsanensis]
MTVDRSETRPLHAQVADALRAEIRDRSIPPGETLPSEAVLCERYGVSRSVVRQALGTLIDEGTVHRARGRAPVAAAATEHHRLVQRVTGLHDQFSSEGLHLSTTVVSLEHVRTAPPAATRHLGTDDLLRLERRRSVGEGPLSHVRTWLPRERFAGLSGRMLDDASLHRVMRDSFGARPTSGRRQIRAVPADPRIARDLGVPAQSPLLLLEGGTFDRDGSPLEWFESWHRSDRVVFDIEAQEGVDRVSLAPPSGEGSCAPVPGTASGPAPAPPEGERSGDRGLERAWDLVEELRTELAHLRRRG